MNSVEAAGNMIQTSPKKTSAGEIVLICCSAASLLLSCILWSPHKQAWMDEIFTWREVSDPSMAHLFYAIQHGSDGGMPVFYTTAWVWAKIFGTGVLTLRLYSCVAMCGALVITWRTIRQFYGMWATAIGVLTMWGTSALLLDQNVEARFYGLYTLAAALAVNLYARLTTESSSKPSLLIWTFLCQVVLVLSHVLGLVYSGLILLGLILWDGRRHRFRFRLYLVHASAWLTLLLWMPAIRASMAAGRPHNWIEMPTVRSLFNAYLFDDSLQWLTFLRLHGQNALFKIVLRSTELTILIPLVSVLLLQLWKSVRRSRPDPRGALLLIAYLLLSAPVILFFLSHLVTPVFMPRYFLPSGIGLSIVLAAFVERLGADNQSSSRLPTRLGWAAIVMFLLLSPLLSILALPQPKMDELYLDVQRLDEVAPHNMPVVAGWGNDFMKIMRYAHDPRTHYYFLLDWPATLAGPKGLVLHYHLMQAYRDSGYYSENIQDSHRFLCSHPDFLLLDTEGASWFGAVIKGMPQFDWKVVDSFDSPGARRSLIAVHRTASLDFCNQP